MFLFEYKVVSIKSLLSLQRIPMLIVALVLFYPFHLLSPLYANEPNTPWQWSNVDRIVVIPDVHGAFTELKKLLVASGVINDALVWIGGKTHLVSLGDLLDRGADSRQVMDLLIRLQQEAALQGGQVHVVAGNHEIMNLMGDLRYVSVGEFAAFFGSKSVAERDKAYTEFVGRSSEQVALSFLGGGFQGTERHEKDREEFNDLFPAGYFGHHDAFSPSGYYGKWLLSLPAVIVINQTAFVHGGLPAVMATADIEKLNSQFSTGMKRYFMLWDELIDLGLMPKYSTDSTPTLANKALRIAAPSTCIKSQKAECRRERGKARDEQRNPSPEALKKLNEFVDLAGSSILGVDGPLWYRGSIRCNSVLELPTLESALANLNATRVVVGHTPTTDRRVHSIRDGRVIMLDTGMLVSRYQGRPASLIIEGSHFQAQYLNPSERTPLLVGGGNGPYPLSNDQLREALVYSTPTNIEKKWFGRPWSIEISYQGVVLNSLFYPSDKKNTHNYELAAYALDQQLGLDIVLLTVERSINGVDGAIQLLPPRVLDEQTRLRKGFAIGGWCPIQPQYDLMAAFDLIIGNRVRSNSNFGYDSRYWLLWVNGHQKAFETHTSLPGIGKKSGFALSAAVANALIGMTEQNLELAVGKWLDGTQRTAILARRDALLASWGTSNEKLRPWLR